MQICNFWQATSQRYGKTSTFTTHLVNAVTLPCKMKYSPQCQNGPNACKEIGPLAGN